MKMLQYTNIRQNGLNLHFRDQSRNMKSFLHTFNYNEKWQEEQKTKQSKQTKNPNKTNKTKT